MGMKQHFIIPLYQWEVCVYYTVDDDKMSEIMDFLMQSGCKRETMISIKRNMEDKEINSGFAYSDYKERKSILVVHKASNLGQFINTIEHEKNHLEMHICEALSINPYSEEAAHFSGDLAQLMFEEAICLIIEL